MKTAFYSSECPTISYYILDSTDCLKRQSCFHTYNFYAHKYCPMRSSRLRIPVDSNVERSSLNKNRNQNVVNMTSYRSRITDAIADTLVGGTITADTALVGTIQAANIESDFAETGDLTVSNTASIANIQVDAIQAELIEAEDFTVNNTASILNIQADSTETETLTVNNTASISDIQAETLTVSTTAVIADAQVSTLVVDNTITASEVVSDSVRIGNVRLVQEGTQLFDMVLPTETGQPGQAMIMDGTGVLSFSYPFILSNVVRVDKNGDDVTGARNGNPKLTIASAISAAQMGDIILVSPGTYNESGLVLPENVSLVGLGRNAIRIGPTAPSTDSTIVTMGVGSAIENVTLTIASASHATFTGIAIPDTAAVDCSIYNVLIRIDNSGASSLGTSNVYGIHSTGTGNAAVSHSAVRNTTVQISSNGLGSKVGILCDTAQHTINVTGCAISSTNDGSGEAAALETNFAGTIANIFNTTLSGGTNDVLQSSGSIVLSGCTLVNRTVGTISPTILTPTYRLVFGFSGGLGASSTRYLYMSANGSTSSNVVRVVIYVPTLIYAVSVNSRLPPGTGNTTTFAIGKNIVDTSMGMELSGSTNSTFITSNAVLFVPGDILTVKVVTGFASQLSDCVVVLHCY